MTSQNKLIKQIAEEYQLKKYKNTFYYYTNDNNELWVEDYVFPLIFKKFGKFNNNDELNKLLENYYMDFDLY